MAKYDPSKEYLSALADNQIEVTLTFDEVGGHKSSYRSTNFLKKSFMTRKMLGLD